MEILILGYCCALENERDGRVSYLLFGISVALTDSLHHNVLGERGGACLSGSQVRGCENGGGLGLLSRAPLIFIE